MLTFKPAIRWGLLMSGLLLSVPGYSQSISLQQAEQLAIDRDPMLGAYRAQSQAWLEKSAAADTLPDPRITLGLLNYPTDTFRRDQEPMTQFRIGLQQMLPRGDSLAVRSRQFQSSAKMSQAAEQNRQQMLRMQVRTTYLELLYWVEAERVVRENQTLFRKLVSVTESQYASGVQRQQDVIRAGLELDMLSDRLDMIRTQQQTIRADLGKLIGHDAAEAITLAIPPASAELPALRKIEDFDTHPMLQIKAAQVDKRQYGIDMAKQAYKPSWMFELGYGFRDGTNPDGSQRADFASAIVSFDVPLFTADKQDRQLAASRFEYQAAVDEHEESRRELYRQYLQAHAQAGQLDARLQRFVKTIIPQARENAEAALYNYQSRRGDFASLMRARITALDTTLKQIRLKIDYRKALAKMTYFSGDAV